MKPIWQQAFHSFTQRYPFLPMAKDYHGSWSYDFGVILMGFQQAYELTGEEEYYTYLKEAMDYYIASDGSIKNYHYEAMNLDYINNGKLLFLLYKKTGAEKYKQAMDQLYQQLQATPRTQAGGFWHKKVYPNQMWLDGLYMAEPFYAEYLLTFKNGSGLADVVQQFQLCYDATLDHKTGLLYHAYDEARIQPWADPQTGHAPHFWGRAMGWYVVALVDTLRLLPKDSPEFQQLATLFTNCWQALKKVQDPTSNCWYQVLDEGTRKGNYLEASATALILNAAAKAVVLNVLPATEIPLIKESYQGLQDEFVLYTKEGWINLIHNCQVAGLGGADQRDGSFTYYMSEPIIANDFKGYGAFLQAALTIENQL